MSAVLLERLDVRNQLVSAVRDGSVQPWFQPVVDLASGRLRGFEALARWTTDSAAIVPSMNWLALAEESGLIIDVDRLILRESVGQLAQWRRDVPGLGLTMAVNFSGRTLGQPGIEAEILDVLAAAGVPADLLTVEVTEGVLIDDEEVGNRLRRLRTAGVVIGLDDFGTGWSSLNYLRRFPVDHLKLDRSFTEDLGRGPASDTIPAAIVQIARGLSLGLVAEGVETLDQRDRLVELGFRTGQGYLFGRAQRAIDLTAQVRASVLPEPAGTVLRLAR
jgi:EAL domain-containing protein (putative c-di-GMP-specific phosphodiesterase class I)